MPDPTDWRTDAPHEVPTGIRAGDYLNGRPWPLSPLIHSALAAGAEMDEANRRLQAVIQGASVEALAVTARIMAAGEQPATTLALDLVRAEAAIARVRELHAAIYVPHVVRRQEVAGPGPQEACAACDVWVPCRTIRALDGEP